MERYKQSIPAIQLSIQRGTEAVPADGHYYVLLGGEVRGRFRTLRQAQALYKTLLGESGYEPPGPPDRIDPGQEAVERYLDELGGYWSESHKHSRRGGKTMYRS